MTDFNDLENTPLGAPQAAETTSTHTSGTPSDLTNAEGQDQQSGNTEAAKWRKRLRETEIEREAMAGRIATLQRSAIVRLAAADLAEPEDLFTIGEATIEDLLDETGDVDPAKVSEAVTVLLDSRPGLHRNARRPVAPKHPNFGQGAGLYTGGGGRSLSWSDALKSGR